MTSVAKRVIKVADIITVLTAFYYFTSMSKCPIRVQALHMLVGVPVPGSAVIKHFLRSTQLSIKF